MGDITRYDPFAELSRFDPFGDDFFRGFGLRPFLRMPEVGPQMRLEVTEDDKAYTVKAEIPGVKKEEIKVSVDGNQVSVSAEVRKEKEEKEGKKVVRSERYYGSVSRSFTLSQNVDEGAAEAKYEDGVLTLTLPKKPGPSAKRVTVS